VKTDENDRGYLNGMAGTALTVTDLQEQAKADAAALAAVPKEQVEKSCTLAAAARLPRIAGLEIKESRLKEIPDEIRTQMNLGSDVLFKWVEIDVTAAGKDVSYSFVCAMNARGQVVVQALGYR